MQLAYFVALPRSDMEHCLGTACQSAYSPAAKVLFSRRTESFQSRVHGNHCLKCHEISC